MIIPFSKCKMDFAACLLLLHFTILKYSDPIAHKYTFYRRESDWPSSGVCSCFNQMCLESGESFGINMASKGYAEELKLVY